MGIRLNQFTLKKFIYPLFFLLNTLSVYGQQDSLANKARISTGLSYNAYRGDLGNGYQSGGLAAHLSFMFAHEKKLHGGLHLAAGSFSGHELSQATPDFGTEILPNTYVKTSFISVHYGLQYDIIRYKGLLLYVSQGLGIIRFSPEDEFGNPLIDALSTRASNESYSNAAAILPTQAGLDYTLPNQIGVGIKAGWLNTTSDYLDNLGQLGSKDGNDNVLQLLLQLHFPLKGNNQ